MQHVFPDYYKEFKCISRDCRHNCCIGWEIDIDGDTAERYKNMNGELGARLKENVEWSDDAHFILGEGERCPFLNGENLCDIICELGEDGLCGICSDHPRFRCELPGRVETGLGLCCEAAGAIILGKKTKTVLEISGEAECEDGIIALRDEIIAILQRRELTVDERIGLMLEACGATLPEITVSEWAELLLGLERLDEAWTDKLNELAERRPETEDFDLYMQGRETEYEQLLVYLIYRHFANSPDEEEAAARGAFAAVGYEVIHALGALQYEKNGEFTLSDQVELCRLFSSEIEYSDENLYEILEELY